MEKITSLSWIIIFSFFVSAMSISAESEITAIEYYKDNNITNQISYFDNRFRLDSQLDEITLLFYRVSGGAPVILVRPDGSKIKVNNHDETKVTWFDDRTYDLVKIKSPMPGPWQVVGNVLPNSKIMVITDVRMQVEPLPKILLAGETLKIEATLFNGKKAIEESEFRDVVHLDVDFYSSNNAEYKNFGADVVKLASFRDDGRDLDEYAADGIFTGEFELKMSPGEWKPEYSIKLPTLERKLAQDSVILRESPVEVSIEVTTHSEGKHTLMLMIDDTWVKPGSMVFQGSITYPTKEVEHFAVMEEKKERDMKKRTIGFNYKDAGIHRVHLNAFGETINGREFRLALHEFTFNVESLEFDDMADSIMADKTNEQQVMAEIARQAMEAEQRLAELKAEQQRKQEERDFLTLMIIIIGNVILCIVAIIGFWLYRRKQNKESKNKAE